MTEWTLLLSNSAFAIIFANTTLGHVIAYRAVIMFVFQNTFSISLTNVGFLNVGSMTVLLLITLLLLVMIGVVLLLLDA